MKSFVMFSTTLVGVALILTGSSQGTLEEDMETVAPIAHNWLNNAVEPLDRFEKLICNNWTIIEIIYETCFKQLNDKARRLNTYGLNFIICTYAENHPDLDNYMRVALAPIVANSSLNDPDYTIWKLFSDFVENRAPIFRLNDVISANSTIRFVNFNHDNQDLIVDRLETYHNCKNEILALPQFAEFA